MSKLSSYKSFINRVKKILSPFIIAICIIAIVVLLLDLVFNILDIEFFIKSNEDHSITSLHSVSIVMLTALLIWVAWGQLSKIHDDSRMEFILHVNERICSAEIIEARSIIQEIVCKIEKKRAIEDDLKEFITSEFAKTMRGMRQDENCARQYKSIRSFMSFLETIAYFCNNHPDLFNSVNELPGPLIIKYYEILEDHIVKRQKNNNNRYYCELSQFVEDMRKKQCRYYGR